LLLKLVHNSGSLFLSWNIMFISSLSHTFGASI
jgi:hypothetical protein